MKKNIDNTPCYCLKMHRSAENVIAYYNRILAPAGITIRQFSIMASILESEEETISKLAEINELDRTTMTRNLTPLLRMGLITNKKKPGQRNSRIAVTDSGRKTFQAAQQLWNKAQDHFENTLGQDGIRALDNAIKKIQEL